MSSKNISSILELISRLVTKPSYKLLLITNSRVSADLRRIILTNNIILIERTAFDEIIKNNEALLRYVVNKT